MMLANGIYFKVVDSDDWLDEAAFHKLMSVLRFWCRTKEEKRPDLVVCNYVYDHLEEGKTKAVRYGNLFPEQKICRWDEIGCFSPEQYLVMHALIFRTGVKASGAYVLCGQPVCKLPASVRAADLLSE